MSQPDPVDPAVERYTAIATGGLLLLVATSLCGWATRLVLAAAHTAAGWPPGMNQLLIPVGITVLVVGFGAWRLLKMGLPARIGPLPLGWAIVTCFPLAAVIGALG